MKYLKFLITAFILFFSTAMLYSESETPNSIFLGLSAGRNFELKHNEFSIMAGYNRHFEGTPEFTLGFLIEGIFAEHFELLLGAPIGFYPIEQLKLWIAPCYAFAIGSEEKEEHSIPPHSTEVEHIEFHNRFMLKFGAGYNHHIHHTNYSLLPFIEGTLVSKEFILSLGVKFSLYF